MSNNELPPKNYVAKGPDLYMEVQYSEQTTSTYIAHYDSDEQAKDAAVRWNERKDKYEKAIGNN